MSIGNELYGLVSKSGDEKMRKGTWLIIAAFVLGTLSSHVIEPRDPASPQAAVAAQIAAADTAAILAAR